MVQIGSVGTLLIAGWYTFAVLLGVCHVPIWTLGIADTLTCFEVERVR